VTVLLRDPALKRRQRVLKALADGGWHTVAGDLQPRLRFRPGRLYVTLHQLERLGMVESYFDHRVRRYRRTV
jgi:DNA-binding transcriptional ArsR family regulator